MDARKELFAGIVGSWTGTYRLWLEPDQLHTTCETTAEARAVLGGRFLRIAYKWSTGGEPQEGELMFGAPGDAGLVGTLVDTWHNGDDILFCAPADGFSVVGTYGPPDQLWHWRTELAIPSGDDFVIRTWNSPPDTAEYVAIEALYTRTA